MGESQPDADAPELMYVVDAAIELGRALVLSGAQVVADYAGDISVPQYRALVLVCYRGPQRPSELASILGVSQATAGRIVTSLARKGLVERTSAPEDMRAVIATLAPAGNEIVLRVTRSRQQAVRRVLADIDPAHYPLLTSLFQSIVKELGHDTLYGAFESPVESW